MGLGNYTQSSEIGRLSGITEPRGSQTGMSTFLMFLFGVPFVGIGVFVALLESKLISVKSSSEAPAFVIGAFGAVFGLAGLLIWSRAWQQFRSNRRRVQVLARPEGGLALADYKWNPHGCQSHCWAKTVKSFAGVGFFALFLSMFNWWAWVAHGPWPLKILVILFDLWLAYLFWLALLTFSRAVRFGDSRIEYARFPCRVNETVVVRWVTPSGIGRADKGTFTLRCVREFYETSGSGDNRSRTIVHEERWNGTWRFEQPESFPAGKNIEFEFQPATGLPATCLSGTNTVYWEFEVNLSMPGPDFKEAYLVPVY